VNNLKVVRYNKDNFTWKTYKHPDNKCPVRITPGPDKFVCTRTAFADKLKSEASEIYGIPSVVADAEKDIKQFEHYITGELVSARDIYIEWGAIRRAQNHNYWCKMVLESIDTNVTNCFVTDWRYPNEAKFMIETYNNVVTVRLYRSDVPEPPIHIDSEHSLDSYRTDILLIRDDLENEFEKTLHKFPQYQGYIPW